MSSMSAELNIIIPVMFIYIFIYPNNPRDVYFYIYSVSAYMGKIEGN